MLYIELVSGVSPESNEVEAGIALDFDDKNYLLSVECKGARMLIDSSKLVVLALPITKPTLKKDVLVAS